MSIKKKLIAITEALLQESLLGVDYAKRKGIRKSVKEALRNTLKNGLSFEDFTKRINENNNKTFAMSWSQIGHKSQDYTLPLKVFPESQDGESYTTVVTESIERLHLIEDVRSAIVLGTLMANRREQPLRILTTKKEASAETYRQFIDAQQITLNKELILDHAGSSDDRAHLPHTVRDIFITTSWQTTLSCLQRVDATQVLLILQQDERLNHPSGDLQIKCEEVLRNEKIRFAVCSKILWDHFMIEGFTNIATTGSWFEPAINLVPPNCHSQSKVKKRKFVAYLNTSDAKCLCRLALSAINDSLVNHSLKPDEWDIVLITNDIEELSFDDGTVPQMVVNPTLEEYLRVVSEADVGLALVAGQHPGLIPLDLAGAGCVVVTSNYGKKTSLASYSQEIISVEPSLRLLQHAICHAVELSNHKFSKNHHASNNSLPKSWEESFAGILNKNL